VVKYGETAVMLYRYCGVRVKYVSELGFIKGGATEVNPGDWGGPNAVTSTLTLSPVSKLVNGVSRIIF